MAELVGGAVLSSVLNVAFDRLSSPEVVHWIRGKKLDKKLATLKTTLYAAQAFLNDAEKKQIRDKAVKDWLSDLKDAVYKADDLLDEISTKAATQKDHPTGNFLSRYLNLQDREMVAKIEDVIDTLDSIFKHKDALGLSEIPKADMSWRVTTSLPDTSDIYGRANDKEAIIKLLLDDTSDSKTSIIPIVGQGGIGKTTLSQWVYHDDRVKQNFDFQAWVCVGEVFDVVKVTKTIIQAITRGSCDTNDLNLLQEELKEKLSRQKIFVVIDDAWNENYNDWNRLLKPFKDGVKGSKILITTRSRNIVSVVKTVPPYELSLLSEKDCWLVFAKHAFLCTDSIGNPTVEEIGREIVSKCSGLPLAAQTLGGLLRGNYDVQYWNHILKSEIWEISEDRSQIISALRISYYYLPPYLKECFLFCSLYPKDYKFDKDELILLWMGENFIQSKGRKTLEEVGYEYFDELVARSFFQPLYINNIDSLFVMHDLMHDLATFYAGEFYFRAEELGNAAEFGIKTRHLSHNAEGNYPISKLLEACDRLKCTRTFLLTEWDRCNMEEGHCILNILSQLKYSRVLSFCYLPLHCTLPDSLGELTHLRYLNLSRSYIKALPESLSNLYNLQTLKLTCCYGLEMLPSGMQNLVNLRHLEIRGAGLKEMPKGMSKLRHLQVLSDYIVGKQEENGIKELGALANLHGSLCIEKLENVINSGEALEARMNDKMNIQILELRWSSGGDIVYSKIERDILDNLRPHRDLKELSIDGYSGIIFPDWLGHSSYHNMTKVLIWDCKNCCMLPSLGQLPFLKHLEIGLLDGLVIIGVEFYKNDEHCLETPFPSLETLTLKRMSCWREWHSFELDVFPQLKKLTIRDCPVLTGDLPKHFPALEELTIEECNQLACCVNEARMQPITAVKNRCESHTSLPLETFPNLTKLNITKCKNMKSLVMTQSPQDDAVLFSSLRSLTIFACPSLSTLGMVAPQLEHLKVEHCDEIDSFPGGDLPPNLRSLRISYSKKLLRWLTLMSLHSHSLTHLEIIDSCKGVKSFPDEGWLPASLQSLSLQKFSSLETLDCKGLAHLTSLQQLTMNKCCKLENIEGEKLPSSLVRLSISWCPLGERCEKKDPQIWPKISHIPDIQACGFLMIW